MQLEKLKKKTRLTRVYCEFNSVPLQCINKIYTLQQGLDKIYNLKQKRWTGNLTQADTSQALNDKLEQKN